MSKDSTTERFYRPDIDGLRAIAVMPVVFYHIGIRGFSGGFVGVDIFFVISGFLITSLIQREISDNTFRFSNFWIRRIRRIIPAVTVVVLGSLAAGYLIMGPGEFKDLADSAVAQSVFSSNIFFWNEIGYFSRPAEAKPLLHTWSLSVEEQFYLLFPLLFVFLKRKTDFTLILLVGLASVSFAISAAGVIGNPTATFYWLPMRAWELLVGAILATVGISNFVSSSPGHRHVGSMYRLKAEIVGWAGLAMIFIAFFSFDSSTPFPGPAAMLPCFGAAAIIWSNGSSATGLKHILSTRPLVWIGLISYSLYLWHWPIIVFYRFPEFDKLEIVEIITILAISVMVSWGSYKFVETPFRRGRLIKKYWKGATALAAALIAPAVLGLLVHLHGGFPQRLPLEALNYANAANDINPRRLECHKTAWRQEGNSPCLLGSTRADQRPKLLTWGDSHLDAIQPILDELAAKSSVPSWHVSLMGCPPILGVSIVTRPNSGCRRFNDEMLQWVVSNGISNVFLVSRWALYAEERDHEAVDGNEPPRFLKDDTGTPITVEENREVFARNYLNTTKRLSELGVTIWVLKQVPPHRFDPPSRLAWAKWRGKDPNLIGSFYTEYVERQKFVNRIIDESRKFGVRVMDPSDIFCKHGFCKTAENGLALYYNADHLSSFGARRLGQMLKPMFESMADR